MEWNSSENNQLDVVPFSEEPKKDNAMAPCMGLESLETLQNLRSQQLLCDATIRLDDNSVYYVHRVILSACSSYFRSLFTTILHSVNVTEAYIPHVTSDAMQGILEYAYSRTLNLTPQNVCQILITADYLCMDGAQKLCCEYIKENTSPENCIGIMLFARYFSSQQPPDDGQQRSFFCHDLESHAYSYILRNFVEVAKRNTELLSLSIEDFCLIIGSDLLNVKSEETVWECVLRWVNADLTDRKDTLPKLLRHIRLGLLDTQYFLEKVKDHEYVTGNELCRPTIIETLRFLYDLETIVQKDSEISTPAIARPRVPHEILFAIGGWSGGSPTNYIESYDTRADRWIPVKDADPVGPRAYHGTAVIGSNIYVIGGFDGMDYFNSCRSFNVVTKRWKEVAPMNARRCYVSVAVLGDEIFALGGYDGHHRQNTGEKYDYRNNQWTLIAPMNMQRSDASATSLNGKIYITGGFNGQECMNTAEAYDPSINQWTMISPMRSRRSGVSCIAFHGSVYVIGGFNGISRMCSGEKYNPANDTWSPIPDMYNPRSNFAMEVIDDLLFVIGGFNGVTTIYHVECFDDNLNEWFEATDMNIFRSALSACVVRDFPNLFDYIHQHRDRLMEEKRQKLLQQERIREEVENAAEAVAVVAAAEAAEEAEAGEDVNAGAENENENNLMEQNAHVNNILHVMPQDFAGALLVAVLDAEGRDIALIEAQDENENWDA